jgi:2,3-bisphosphoglycerate-independent phosphoglycerate mutase
MKTVLIVYEGMADRAAHELDNRTPMAVARCPVATEWAIQGRGGMITVPRGATQDRSEAMLGRYLQLPEDEVDQLWRGPLEALATGLACAPTDGVFCADFVTMDGEKMLRSRVLPLTMKETETLTAAVQAAWPEGSVRLTAIRPGRVLVVVDEATYEGARSVPPYELEGAAVENVWTGLRQPAFVRQFVDRSREVLAHHPVNDVRVDLGENPANALWPWGGGRALTPRAEALPGVMASVSGMARGLAKYAGMHSIGLLDPWATQGGKRASFKISSLVPALREQDMLAAYVEAPCPSGIFARAADKVRALEMIDHAILAPLHTVLEACRPYRVALCVDRAAAKDGRRAVRLPWILAGEGVEPDGVGHWDEKTCADGALGRGTADQVMDGLRKE